MSHDVKWSKKVDERNGGSKKPITEGMEESKDKKKKIGKVAT